MALWQPSCDFGRKQAAFSHLQGLVAQLRQTRKYVHTCDDALRRVAGWALARHAKPKEAVKAAKRKLLQVCAAYLAPECLAKVEAAVLSLPTEPNGDDMRDMCRRILGTHASTAERLGILENVYSTLFAITGRPRVVLHLACGLHPFALLWMGLGLDVEYHAVDLDHRLIACINAFFARLG